MELNKTFKLYDANTNVLDVLSDFIYSKIFVEGVSSLSTVCGFLGKKELNEWKGRGRPPSFKLTEKESDWKTYYGSHEFIKEEIKKGNQSNFTRKILQFAFSKKELTYLENKWLFSKAVLETDEYLNDNIEGRYFKKDFNSGE